MAISRHSRRRQRFGSGKLPPLAIVGICLAAAVILVLILGNLLRLWLDGETYQKLIGDSSASGEPPKTEVNSQARKINAYPYVLGTSMDSVKGRAAVSVEINSTSGRLSYTSDVAALLGTPQNEEVTLQDAVGELSVSVPYISGVFYPQAFSQQTSDLLYAAAVQEAALLREFYQAGGSEILLCELPLRVETLSDVASYLAAVKSALPDTAVGVAIPLSVASSQDGWEIIATLLQSCDFCALDLREEAVTDAEPVTSGISPAATALLTECDYLLTQYDMRILLASHQVTLLTTLELRLHQNFQVVASQKTPE